MATLTPDGYELDNGMLVQWPDDGEIRVVDIDGNTVDIYREGDAEYRQWAKAFKRDGWSIRQQMGLDE